MAIKVLEAANLFAGDDTPNDHNSKHLSLTSVKAVAMKEKTQTHSPGGGVGDIVIGGLGFEAPQLSFKLLGIDEQTKALFGIGDEGIKPFTIYGAVRNKKTGFLLERKMVVWGRIVEIDEDEFSRGKIIEQTHTLAEIVRFSLWESGAEIWGYSFDPPDWRVNGVSKLAAQNSILRIPGAN